MIWSTKSEYDRVKPNGIEVEDVNGNKYLIIGGAVIRVVGN